MRNRIIAALVALFSIIGITVMTSSAPAVAAPAPAAFVAPSHIIYPISNLWNPAQTTITFSDRTGQPGLRVSQSQYAWTSYAKDGIKGAYTTLTSCTGCVIVTVKPKGDPAITTNIANTSRTVFTDPNTHVVYTKACSIVFQKEYWAAHTDYRQRQRAMTHEIGHCLGFGHSVAPWNTCEASIEANVYCAPATRFTPSDADYVEMEHEYAY